MAILWQGRRRHVLFCAAANQLRKHRQIAKSVAHHKGEANRPLRERPVSLSCRLQPSSKKVETHEQSSVA